MENVFDICVDSDTLYNLENKIDLILHDLEESTDRMTRAIQTSENFLAGNQFEKAKQTTMNCMIISQKTAYNLSRAQEYLRRLQDSVTEYGQCVYKGAE